MKRLLPLLLLLCMLGACGGGNNAEPAGNDAPNVEPQTEEVKPKELSLEQRQQADKLFNEAQFASMQRDNTKAAELFFQALEINPNFKEAHANLARVLHELGRYTEAYDHFLRASELEDVPKAKRFLIGKAAEACLANAEKAEKAGEYKLAEEFVNDAHKLVPETVDSLFLLARLKFARGAYKDARETYRLASEIAMGEARRSAIYQVAQCSYALEEFEDAEKQFSTIINEGYTAQNVHGYRGYCRYKLNDYEGAISDFQQAQKYATSVEKRQEYADVEVQLTQALEGND